MSSNRTEFFTCQCDESTWEKVEECPCRCCRCCRERLGECLIALLRLVHQLYIIVWKNFRIRRRRYVALLIELAVPVLVVVIMASLNAKDSLFRSISLTDTDETNPHEKNHSHLTNHSVEKFYDLGSDYRERIILDFTLCKRDARVATCFIGYVADDLTAAKIFENKTFLANFEKGEFWNLTNVTKGGGSLKKKTVFVQFPNEASIDVCLKKPEKCPQFKNRAHVLLDFRGAVIFHSGLGNLNINYTIRLMEKYYDSLHHVFKTTRHRPSIFDKREFIKSYIKSGFLSLQLLVDRMILLHTNSTVDKNSKMRHLGSKIDDKMTLHEMPHQQTDQLHYPEDSLVGNQNAAQEQSVEDELGFITESKRYDGDNPLTAKRTSISIFVLVLSFSFLIPSEQRRIVTEKESGLTILLMVTGMTHRMQWVGNLVSVMLLYSICITVMTVFLKIAISPKQGAVFKYCSGPVIWILLFLYMVALCSANYLTAVFFDRPVLAITASVSIIVVTFIGPFSHIDVAYDTFTFGTKLFFCIHPSIALHIAFKLLIRYEKLNIHTHLFTIGHSIPTDQMRLIYIFIILISEGCIFMILAIYLDRVLKSKHGVTKPWYYIFQPSQYGTNTQKVAPSKVAKLAKRTVFDAVSIKSDQNHDHDDHHDAHDANEDHSVHEPGKAKGHKGKSVFIQMDPETEHKKEKGPLDHLTSGHPLLHPNISRRSTRVARKSVYIASLQFHKPEESPFETFTYDVEPSVETKNLGKNYGSTEALKGLNIQLYHGEIFALLGHNGAGKSTLLNLFSGYTAPSCGTATICGYDLTTHIVQIQSFTGMCPQSATLYEDLTCIEHLRIFGLLRGLSGNETREEAVDLMEKLNLGDMTHHLTRNLSKGDKRKLSLAIALIGNPKLIILDEPTGGMDYYSRRAVWDLLLKIRSNHTIIFSTHFMDEAELLGDRIGILVHGKMEVIGSAHFLRRHFNLGYSLKMTIDPSQKPDVKAILELVRRAMPNATLNTLPISPDANRVCNINLPIAEYSANAMSSLFSHLAQFKEDLGVVGFSVSLATMDEVFVSLMRKVDPSSEVLITPDDENPTVDIARLTRHRNNAFIQFLVLVQKKFYFTIRKRIYTLFQCGLPLIIIIIATIRLCSLIDLGGRDAPALTISWHGHNHKNLITPIFPSEEYNEEVMKAVIGYSAKKIDTSDIPGELVLVDYMHLRNNYIIGVATDPADHDKLHIFLSPYWIHSSPLAINTYSNILYKRMLPLGNITTQNHPFQHPYFKGYYFEDDKMGIDGFSALATISITLLLAFTVIVPLDERLSEFKHLQLMSGVSSAVYWIAILLSDLLIIITAFIFLQIFTFTYPKSIILTDSLNLDHSVPVAAGILLITYGYCGIMMMYTFSHFAHSISGSFALFVAITLLLGVIIPCFTMSIPIGAGKDPPLHGVALNWPLRLFPIYSLTSAFRKYAATVLGNAKCNYLTEAGIKYLCNGDLVEHKIKLIHRTALLTCCVNCPNITGSEGCYHRGEILTTPWTVSYHSYAELEAQIGPHLHENVHHFINTRSFFYEIICFVVSGMVFNFLTIFLDSDVWRYLEACVLGMRGRAFQTDVEDEDITNEMERVDVMMEGRMLTLDALVAHDLCKTYGIFPAVHNVSFGVHYGECFGILGVNGAGKSTLFKLLTASTVETYGNVYSGGCSLTNHRTRLMKKMGYSAHHGGGMVTYLTPAEHLRFIARLRGLTGAVGKIELNELLRKLNLQQEANKRTGTLSGGTKRRLSAAMAIIGHPPIILFDEPTSAADPASRRFFWTVIKDAKRQGQTVIFNSHRILEAEALCQRIGILIDGKFQCLGSPSHLKEKFGQGFKLMIKLVPGPAENQGYVSSLSNTVVEMFNPCTLRDRRRNVVQYVIHDSQISWDYLFQSMEHIKLRYNDLVEDYAFSETTLEEVFLQFVVLQHCGRTRDVAGGCGC